MRYVISGKSYHQKPETDHVQQSKTKRRLNKAIDMVKSEVSGSRNSRAPEVPPRESPQTAQGRPALTRVESGGRSREGPITRDNGQKTLHPAQPSIGPRGSSMGRAEGSQGDFRDKGWPETKTLSGNPTMMGRRLSEQDEVDHQSRKRQVPDKVWMAKLEECARLQSQNDFLRKARHDQEIHERQLKRDYELVVQSLHEEARDLQRLEQAKTRREALLEAELKNERQLIEDLKNTIKEQEAQLNQAHGAAINLLIQDVSTTYPDDHIKRDLQSFLEDNLLGWCIDYAVDKIEDPNAGALLVERKILTKLPDATRPTIPIQLLLRAALTQHLYQTFLRDPFAPWDFALTLNSKTFAGKLTLYHRAAEKLVAPRLRCSRLTTSLDVPRQHFTSWRVQTLSFLETAITRPHHCADFEVLVRDFASSYACMLQPLDKQALEELAEIHSEFYELSLKLWKRRSQIIVDGVDHPDFQTYKAGTPGLEVDSTVFLDAGNQDVTGLPVQALIRPRVVGLPVLNNGQLGESVVWSNAVVWVTPPSKS